MKQSTVHSDMETGAIKRGVLITGAVSVLFFVFVCSGCGVPDDIHGKTNSPPVITDYSPKEVTVSAVDGQLLNFWIIASDPDNNTLVYSWQLNGNNVSNGTYYNFNASIAQGTRQVLTVVVSDPSGLQAEKTWLIYVTSI